MNSSLAIDLPRGLLLPDGQRARAACLRPLSGRWEARLCALAVSAEPSVVSQLLAYCLERVGQIHQVGLAQARRLVRGDRQVLLLHLHKQLFGDQLALILRCPNPACGQEADLDLRIQALLPKAQEQAATTQVQTPMGTMLLREPTGLDDETCISAPQLFSQLLLGEGGRPTPEQVALWSPGVRGRLGLALTQLQRSPRLAFVTPCPSCKALYEAVLNPARLLGDRMRGQSDRLLAEVHTLALHYHWPEADVLDMPRARRWRYLELLRREFADQPLISVVP